ncbi:MAG: spermidine/putrescine ABC transporter substrate-binding protein [Lachnospiraceae bacterium]|nr:spermidine/putrescine ABC transporter substrate-binding protein [Lachnospiraceae bacterium]
MKKLLALLLTGCMTLSMLTGCGNSENKGTVPEETAGADTADQKEEAQAAGQTAGGELNLFTWDGMFPQEILDGFEEETGIRINYSNFDSDEDMLAKLEEAKGGDYDLVIADDYIIEMAIAEGLAQKLDKAKLSNWGNINPIFQGYFYDEEDEYTVPYGAGIPLIVYDPEVTGFDLTSYEDLWNPALEDNVALVANYRVIDGIVLKSMGESFNTEDTAVIEKAGEKLKELAPNVRVINDNNTQDFLLSGEVGAAFLYTSQVTMALSMNPDLKVCYPEEGLGFGIMAGFIPSKAPNPDAAHAFLNYILDAEHAAACFEYMGYYCTNKAAEEYISEEVKDMIVVPDTVTKGEIIQNISQEAEDMHSKIWNEFKSACD